MSISDRLLKRFVTEYDRDDNYYDWGDDPAFFSAEHRLGDVRKASWGVCRADVRGRLEPGDMVVFFCARQEPDRVWDYYFIGVGTVAEPLTREEIWRNEKYSDYRSFYNIMAKLENGRLVQYEAMTHHDDDWEHRASSPYWLFDPKNSAFNLRHPLNVARYARGTMEFEDWYLEDPLVERLHRLLFSDRKIDRHLRTRNRYIAHAPLNLQSKFGPELRELRRELIRLLEST